LGYIFNYGIPSVCMLYLNMNPLIDTILTKWGKRFQQRVNRRLGTKKYITCPAAWSQKIYKAIQILVGAIQPFPRKS
jgi:hypothetical protein